MNKADNDASTRAIDSLINYEVRPIIKLMYFATILRYQSMHVIFVLIFSLSILSDIIFPLVLDGEIFQQRRI